MNIKNCLEPADNVFYCTKSFDGRNFKNLPDRISRHEVKTIKHVKKPHVKVIVSDKSIFSTLSPKKGKQEIVKYYFFVFFSYMLCTNNDILF